MKLADIKFPIYKIRKYLDKKDALGLIKIKAQDGNWYYLDDKTLKGGLGERRLIIKQAGHKLYKLNEQITTLRKMTKYPTGTIFIDDNGSIFKYEKSSKFYPIVSKKIKDQKRGDGYDIFWVENDYFPHISCIPLKENGIEYASFMQTKYGPFLYDFTRNYHEPYKRKI
jgi:hypothetical protein